MDARTEGPGPTLDDLARVHWEPLARSPRARTALRVLLLALPVVSVGAVVVLAVGGERAPWSLAPFLLVGLQPLLARQGVQLDAHGLRRRHGVLRLRRVPWEDVVAVEPPGRWRDGGLARCTEGREVSLSGMGLDDVTRLAAALADERSRD